MSVTVTMPINDISTVQKEPKPQWLVAELRSDHAGETGAIWIYRGILSVTKEKTIKAFAKAHLATEISHLNEIERFLDKKNRSTLVPLWRILGFFTGALPALFGPGAIFATISAVESFVVLHYQSQIHRLENENSHPHIRSVLQSCCDDEAEHESEATSLLIHQPGTLLITWCRLVSVGSKIAVKLARVI